jgi:hypothetical protein
MRYTVQHLSEEDFKRSTGDQCLTFDIMRQMIEQKLGIFGRPQQLSRADQFLLTLMYWREDRAKLHFALPAASANRRSTGRLKRLKTP